MAETAGTQPGDAPGEEPVLVETRGQIVVVTLNRPQKLNAADLAMQRLLLRRWREIRDDEGARAVVVTGAGRAFCSGGDLSVLRAFQAGDDALHRELNHINREMLECILSLEVPVIAAVNGPAIGFGAALAAMCDLVVMGQAAYLSEPHARHGIGASPGCQLVWPLLTSVAVAKELLMSGRPVPAEEALRLGLVSRVCEDGQELPTALGLAEELAAVPRAGTAAVKAAFNQPLLEEARRRGWASGGDETAA